MGRRGLKQSKGEKTELKKKVSSADTPLRKVGRSRSERARRVCPSVTHGRGASQTTSNGTERADAHPLQ